MFSATGGLLQFCGTVRPPAARRSAANAPTTSTMTSELHSPARIRPATAEDTSAIVDLIRPFVDAGTLLPRTANEILALAGTSFVAECQGRIVGFAALEVYSP